MLIIIMININISFSQYVIKKKTTTVTPKITTITPKIHKTTKSIYVINTKTTSTQTIITITKYGETKTTTTKLPKTTITTTESPKKTKKTTTTTELPETTRISKTTTTTTTSKSTIKPNENKNNTKNNDDEFIIGPALFRLNGRDINIIINQNFNTDNDDYNDGNFGKKYNISKLPFNNITIPKHRSNKSLISDEQPHNKLRSRGLRRPFIVIPRARRLPFIRRPFIGLPRPKRYLPRLFLPPFVRELILIVLPFVLQKLSKELSHSNFQQNSDGNEDELQNNLKNMDEFKSIMDDINKDDNEPSCPKALEKTTKITNAIEHFKCNQNNNNEKYKFHSQCQELNVLMSKTKQKIMKLCS